jgi:hypothetical protein
MFSQSYQEFFAMAIIQLAILYSFICTRRKIEPVYIWTEIDLYLNPYAVLGWFQGSFVGIEQESAYNLLVGYLKGAEQAGASAALVLDVMTKFSNASKLLYSITIISNRVT